MDLLRTAADIAERVLRCSPRCGNVKVLAIDGGAASGKSSLASAVHEQLHHHGVSTQLVRTDDLVDGWDGQFSFGPRLRADVLDPLARNEPGSYRRYDWVLERFSEDVAVAIPAVLIVEGVSAIDCCAERTAFSVFLDVSRATRESRWMQRDADVLQPSWIRWLDREDQYFTANPPKADLIL